MIRQSVSGILLLCVATAMSVPTQSNDVRAVSNGANEFSTNLYKTIAEKQNGNLIMSPLSVSVVLSMASYGARKTTAEQLNAGLHMPKDASVSKSGNQGLVDSLNNAKDVELRLANKIYTDKKFSVKPDFESITKTYFRSTSESLDFSKSTDAATAINNWAKSQTNDKIKDLVEAGDLKNTVMVLLNAVYFKGKWKAQFNVNATKDRPFHVDANTVKQVPTMYNKDNYKYGQLEEANATFIVLPYKGDDLSMVIILPDEGNSLSELEKNLDKIDIFNAIDQAREREVKVYLPKFKIESKLKLKEPLTQLGMGEMFSDSADFSGISDAPLQVSDAVQKAFIEVNEEGSEAAAVTELGIMLASLPLPPHIIDVNRPFIYTIIKKNPNSVLFQGRVVIPIV